MSAVLARWTTILTAMCALVCATALATEKMYLIVKPEQSGKTREILTIINSIINRDSKTIPIIFCDNSLLQVGQIVTRVKNNLGIEIDWSGAVEVSSTAKCKHFIGVDKKMDENCVLGKIRAALDNTDDDYADILSDEPYNENEKKESLPKALFCCAHPKKFEEVEEFLKAIQIIKKRPRTAERWKDINFQLFFDEASKNCLGKNATRIKKWASKDVVEKVYLIDATPHCRERGLFKTYKSLKLSPFTHHMLEHTDIISECYVGIDDFTFDPLGRQIREATNAEYINEVLNADPLIPTDILFAPANTLTKDHEQVRDKLLSKNCVVVMLNGTHKGYYVPNRNGHMYHTFDAKMMKKCEINVLIEEGPLRVAREKGLPLSIVGGLVPGRGLTLQGSMNELVFTRAIFGPQVATNDLEKSQKMGRLKGHIRSNPNWSSPRIHCSEEFENSCRYMEKLARWLIDCAKEGHEGNERVMSEDEIDEETQKIRETLGMREKKKKRGLSRTFDYQDFETITEANKFWKKFRTKAGWEKGRKSFYDHRKKNPEHYWTGGGGSGRMKLSSKQEAIKYISWTGVKDDPTKSNNAVKLPYFDGFDKRWLIAWVDNPERRIIAEEVRDELGIYESDFEMDDDDVAGERKQRD